MCFFNSLAFVSSKATIQYPLSPHQTNRQIAGFVDNITTLMTTTKDSAKYIKCFLQQDAHTWEQLLHTIGGKLELDKFEHVIITWAPDKRGVEQLAHTTLTTLHIWNSTSQTVQTISQLSPNASYKYFGVHIAVDGNMKAQPIDKTNRCNLMGLIFSQNYFNATDASLGYTMVYSPSTTSHFIQTRGTSEYTEISCQPSTLKARIQLTHATSRSVCN
jgi:hypothetical protein